MFAGGEKPPAACVEILKHMAQAEIIVSFEYCLDAQPLPESLSSFCNLGT